MKKFFNWQLRLGLAFLLVSASFYTLHYRLFADPGYIFRFLIAQLGFLPISVFLVTMVLNQLLRRREKLAMLKKLNMVIGSFFSEVGGELLRHCAAGDAATHRLRQALLVGPGWRAADYARARHQLADFSFALRRQEIDWPGLRDFLDQEKGFLLALLGNPNLLEHESFTDLLWAVFHLAEELGSRQSVQNLPESDYAHLLGDVQRVYSLLLGQWLAYLEHLQEDYPYLFSLAVRTNPFDPEARPEVC